MELQAVFDALARINNNHGRGNLINVNFNAVTTPELIQGTVTRYIPATQRTGFTEDRRFTIQNGTLWFLGRRRKIA